MDSDTQIIKKAWWKNIELWLYTALSTFVGGGASSVAAVVIDPQKFNLSDGLGNVGKMFLTSGIINVIFYLSKSPLPKLPSYEKPVSNPVSPVVPPAP